MSKHNHSKPAPTKSLAVTLFFDDLFVYNAFVTIESLDKSFTASGFTDASGKFTFHNIPDTVIHINLTIEHLDYKSFSNSYFLAPVGTSIVTIRLEAKANPIIYPTIQQVKAFKGNFCGIKVAGLRQFNGEYPADLLYTPAYGCYNDDERKLIRQRYREEFGEWAHFPVVLQPGPIYGNYYPNINPTVTDQKLWLEELYRDKIIPVVGLLADWETEISLAPEVLAMVKCAFPKWEQNQPNPETGVQKKYIVLCRAAVSSDCILFLHFTPEHGAIDSPESEAWQWCAANGVNGILVQTIPETDKDIPTEDVLLARAIDTHQQFIDRLKFGKNDWPHPLLVISFETKAYPRFHNHESYESCIDFAKSVRLALPDLDGYCNG